MNKHVVNKYIAGKRFLLRALLSVCLLGMLSCSGVTNQPPPNPHNICDMFAQQKGWQAAADKSALRWGVSTPVLMAIMYHESSFVADARPPYKKSWFPFFRERISTAYGYAQALDGTWEEYLQSTGNRGAKRDHFGDAVDFIGWYSHLSYKRSRISKLDAYRLYLAYHEGHAGYNRGSYNKKQWLIRVAEKVRVRAANYMQQLNSCS